MKPAYRPDIDGLRAIAVSLVILFHAGVPGLPGGYVGVDIFFVISGYLITGILRREIADGSYSIARFYERRIRRIFPALIAVLLATTLAGLLIMTPAQMVDYSKSLIATILFVSNMYLGMQTNYFAADAETQALLHTWSLAVEEQFYIVFPLLLAGLARYRPRWITPAVWLFAALSFAACVVLTPLRPTAAFYLAPTRAWELLAGSLLALHAPRRARPGLAQGIGLAGLALIAIAAFGFRPGTPFPGSAAAVPVLGAVALILAGGLGGGAATRLLCAAPMRAIGLISYSLYLWHWPVIVLLRGWSITAPTPWQMAGAVGATVLLAILSWKYVEQPFRHAGQRPQRLRHPVLWAGAAGMAAVLLVGVGLVLGKGVPQRFSPEELALLQSEGKWTEPAGCRSRPDLGAPQLSLCDIGAPEAERDILVWGDSHALALHPALDGAMHRLGQGGYFVGEGGCAPLLGLGRPLPPYDRICLDNSRNVLAMLERNPGIHTVYLVSRWAIYERGIRFKHQPGPLVFVTDAASPAPSLPENARAFARALKRTVDTFEARGLKIVVLTQVPDVDFSVSTAMGMSRHLGREIDLRTSRADYEAHVRTTAAQFAPYAAEGRIGLRSLADLLCDAQICRVATRDGLPAYSDDNHLSRQGAQELVEPLAAMLRP